MLPIIDDRVSEDDQGDGGPLDDEIQRREPAPRMRAQIELAARTLRPALPAVFTGPSP